MKKSNSLRSQVCTLANSIYQQGWSLSDAFVKAWQVIKLKRFLKSGGKALVTFIKSDKTFTERVAEGVNDSNYEFKGTERKVNPFVITYFDNMRQAIRSMNAMRLVYWDIVSM